MSISSLVLELWQFPFIRDYQKSGHGKYPALVCPNICRLDQVRDTEFCRDISNKLLLNTAKCQVYSFSRFWVMKGKLIQGVELSNYLPEKFVYFSQKRVLFLTYCLVSLSLWKNILLIDISHVSNETFRMFFMWRRIDRVSNLHSLVYLLLSKISNKKEHYYNIMEGFWKLLTSY